MTQRDFTVTSSANVAAQEAFDKICRVSDWWTQGFSGASQSLGDTFTVRFGETFVDFRVVEVIPAKRIVWQVIDSNLHFQPNKTEWNNTRVVWDLSAEEESIKIRMTHVGLVPEHQCYENCEQGWNFYVRESLGRLLTENKGLPDGKKRFEMEASRSGRAKVE